MHRYNNGSLSRTIYYFFHDRESIKTGKLFHSKYMSEDNEFIIIEVCDKLADNAAEAILKCVSRRYHVISGLLRDIVCPSILDHKNISSD